MAEGHDTSTRKLIASSLQFSPFSQVTANPRDSAVLLPRLLPFNVYLQKNLDLAQQPECINY